MALSVVFLCFSISLIYVVRIVLHSLFFVFVVVVLSCCRVVVLSCCRCRCRCRCGSGSGSCCSGSCSCSSCSCSCCCSCSSSSCCCCCRCCRRRFGCGSHHICLGFSLSTLVSPRQVQFSPLLFPHWRQGLSPSAKEKLWFVPQGSRRS